MVAPAPFPPAPFPKEPLVSLLMVVRNGAAHIDAALASARRQTLAGIEIIVVDDRSSDATPDIIRRHAAQDPRVIAIRGHARGLAAVRNLSITAAAAPFVAVLDSDDILHPRHVENLLDLATRTGADLAASNMIAFSSDTPPTLFAPGEPWQQERRIGHTEFVQTGLLDRQTIQLGYLKPLFRVAALRRHGLVYDQRLRIGEDWDLVERAFAAGLSYAYRPEPTYYYRRHAASTSFRWQTDDLVGLIAAERDRLAGEAQNAPETALTQARRARLASLEDTLAHCEAVGQLKARRVGKALPHLLRRPGAMVLLAQSLREGVMRRAAALGWRSGRTAQPDPMLPHVLLCGEARPGSPVAIAAALVKASGWTIRKLSRAQLADPLTTARAGQGAAMVLLAEEALADAAAHAIGDGAPFVAAAGTRHPRVDYLIEPHSCGQLLGLLPVSGGAGAGLPRGGSLAGGLAA